MKFKLFIGTAIMILGRANAQSPQEFIFSNAWAQAEEQNIASDARNYLKKWRSARENWKVGDAFKLVTWPEEKAIENCVTAIFPGPKNAKLVFSLNADGFVTEATSDQSGYIEQCVKEKVIGLQMPKPPFAPYLICSSYEKIGGGQTKTLACGPKPLEKTCTRAGNSESCILKELT